MDYLRLLSLNRSEKDNKNRKNENPLRTGFEVDYDRIIFSTPFRFLQDKTQVIPFSKSGFVHTRLTHSLEVSVVGRSLGKKVGKTIIQRDSKLAKYGYIFNDIANIVASACLAHDIGNPPFGHSGESAIGSFFKSGKGLEVIKHFTKEEQLDLQNFEGNANGFKILTQGTLDHPTSLRLTFATLGTFIKYPKNSIPIIPHKHICEKKFGFFQTEKHFFNSLIKELGLEKNKNGHSSFYRHPLTFLVEAADDICYSLMDFEDAINLEWLSEENIELLYDIAKQDIKTEFYKNLKTKKQKTAYLRAVAIGVLVEEVAEIFIEHEIDILKGIFPVSLLDKSSYNTILNEILNISKEKVYQAPSVIEKIIVGHKAIFNILNTLIEAVKNKIDERCSTYDELLLKMLPKNIINKEKTLYENILNSCSYLATMSDTNLIELNQKLEGIS